ncbi:hypothetical protein RBWH47_01575 [Rhodopirellula baltica WH47]|uniref:Uncharacterized protein n=1 Tax=Rhodopirellula baltica WH47 TaxID=991778 RepID=F2AKQ0_RHOBT|nr:hypothetical protein RBWH47_01575 [Rhodopirellula baltica WH47]
MRARIQRVPGLVPALPPAPPKDFSGELLPATQTDYFLPIASK